MDVLRSLAALTVLLGLGVAGGHATAATRAETKVIAGIAIVVDGDTLEVDGQRIRLHAVDAPEKRQTCEAAGSAYACGLVAAAYLRSLIADSILVCTGRRSDRFRRLVAICHRDEEDIGQLMVQAGWAKAAKRFSQRYSADEAAAKHAAHGLWAGTFDAPSTWRRSAKSPKSAPDRATMPVTVPRSHP